MTERSSPDSALQPDDVLREARELMKFYESQPLKPYTAGVLADCIATIERLRASVKPDAAQDVLCSSCAGTGYINKEKGIHCPDCWSPSAPPQAAQKPIGFMEAMNMVERGFDTWKDKPHNAKWYNRIDGTPIPNDLKVNIAEAIRDYPLSRPEQG
jgi:hypothetical protein